ncbi:hypothetical protein ACFLZ2_05595 [Candidatus Margulisiibacteriota bacterium]
MVAISVGGSKVSAVGRRTPGVPWSNPAFKFSGGIFSGMVVSQTLSEKFAPVGTALERIVSGKHGAVQFITFSPSMVIPRAKVRGVTTSEFLAAMKKWKQAVRLKDDSCVKTSCGKKDLNEIVDYFIAVKPESPRAIKRFQVHFLVNSCGTVIDIYMQEGVKFNPKHLCRYEFEGSRDPLRLNNKV